MNRIDWWRALAALTVMVLVTACDATPPDPTPAPALVAPEASLPQASDPPASAAVATATPTVEPTRDPAPALVDRGVPHAVPPPKPSNTTWTMGALRVVGRHEAVRTYRVGWSEPAGYADQFLLYNTVECPRGVNRKNANTPCFVAGTPVDVSKLELLAKAPGIATVITRLASITAPSSRRTGSASGSNQLVNQVLYCHAHHTTNNKKRVSNAPPTVGWSRRSRWESWVMAKT